MIQYEVTLAREGYFPGEEVQVRLQITNRGTEPLQLPDPKAPGSTQAFHTLWGPGYPGGIRFSNTALLDAPINPVTPAEPANQKLITIAPAAIWNTVFSLGSIVSHSLPGQYRLRSAFESQGVKAESKEVTFNIQPLALRSVHLGLGLRPFDNGEGEVAFLHSASGSNHLYTLYLREMRPSIGEAGLGDPIYRLAVGPEATEVAVPWRNSPFFNELLRYVLWREDQSIKLLSSTSKTPFSFAPPAGISQLVRPPLKVTGGPVEIAAVSADAGSLQWVRFDPTSGVGVVGWTIPLPATPHGITTALGPEVGGSKRHLAFTTASKVGIELHYTRFAETSLPEPLQSTRVDGWQVFDGVAPSILEEADGTVIIIISVVGKRDGKNVCAMVEIKLGGPDGKAHGEPLITQLGVLPSRPVAGAVMLVDKEGRVNRRELVIGFASDPPLKLRGRDQLVPVSVPGIPTAPILLAPGQKATYIIYTDPERGLVVEPL